MEVPSPHELCFARLGLKESEICWLNCPSSCTEKAFQGQAGVTVGQACLFWFGEGLDHRMLSVGRCAKEEWQQRLEGTARSWRRMHPVGMGRVAQGEAENGEGGMRSMVFKGKTTGNQV